MRPKIAEFQNRLRGLTLGHGTHRDAVASIHEKGLTEPYNYACVDQGWEMHGRDHANVQFRADVVADRTYPDPEGQWGSHNHTGYSMRTLVEEYGSLDLVLDELERCLNGDGWLEDFEDPLDPSNYNLVVVGPVPPDAILK